MRKKIAALLAIVMVLGALAPMNLMAAEQANLAWAQRGVHIVPGVGGIMGHGTGTQILDRRLGAHVSIEGHHDGMTGANRAEIGNRGQGADLVIVLNTHVTEQNNNIVINLEGAEWNLRRDGLAPTARGASVEDHLLYPGGSAWNDSGTIRYANFNWLVWGATTNPYPGNMSTADDGRHTPNRNHWFVSGVDEEVPRTPLPGRATGPGQVEPPTQPPVDTDTDNGTVDTDTTPGDTTPGDTTPGDTTPGDTADTDNGTVDPDEGPPGDMLSGAMAIETAALLQQIFTRAFGGTGASDTTGPGTAAAGNTNFNFDEALPAHLALTPAATDTLVAPNNMLAPGENFVWNPTAGPGLIVATAPMNLWPDNVALREVNNANATSLRTAEMNAIRSLPNTIARRVIEDLDPIPWGLRHLGSGITWAQLPAVEMGEFALVPANMPDFATLSANYAEMMTIAHSATDNHTESGVTSEANVLAATVNLLNLMGNGGATLNAFAVMDELVRGSNLNNAGRNHILEVGTTFAVTLSNEMEDLFDGLSGVAEGLALTDTDMFQARSMYLDLVNQGITLPFQRSLDETVLAGAAINFVFPANTNAMTTIPNPMAASAGWEREAALGLAAILPLLRPMDDLRGMERIGHGTTDAEQRSRFNTRVNAAMVEAAGTQWAVQILRDEIVGPFPPRTMQGHNFIRPVPNATSFTGPVGFVGSGLSYLTCEFNNCGCFVYDRCACAL